jgi:hypothetical protein
VDERFIEPKGHSVRRRELPFKFGGTIDKVTYRIGPEKLSAADVELMRRAVAAGHDTPAP